MRKMVLIFSILAVSLSSYGLNTPDEAAARARLNKSDGVFSTAWESVKSAASKAGDSVSTWGSSVAADMGTTWSNVSGFSGNSVDRLRASLGQAIGGEMVDAQASDNRVDANARKGYAETAKKAEQARKDMAAYEQAKSELSKAVSKMGTDISEAAGAAGDAAAVVAKDKYFAANFRLMHIQEDFSVLQSRFYTINDAMTMLERRGDRSAMGAYIQEKMARLLNSDVLCSAQKSCDANGKNKGDLKLKDLQAIFPRTSGEVRNSTNSYKSGTGTK
jgi:hypothetical protein